MKIKKIDLSAVKDYLFQKGERVGLVICGIVALLLLVSGLMKAVGASAPYAENFKKPRLALEDRLKLAAELQKPDKQTVGDDWPDKLGNFFDIAPLIVVNDDYNNQRRNPNIVKILEENVRADYKLGAYFSYELKNEKVAAWDGNKAMAAPQGGQVGGPRLVKITKPVHMIVVSAVFPMKEQWEEYVRALNLPNLAELKNNDENKKVQPKPLGLIVFRREVKPVFTETDWETVYGYDPKENKIVVAERIDKLFKEAIIDEVTPALITENHYQAGDKLMTPLPLLANMQYPELNFKEIKVLKREELDKKGGPTRKIPSVTGSPATPAGNNAAAPALDYVAWDKLPKDLSDKFSGKIDYFDPSGILGDPDNPTPMKTRIKIKPGKGPVPGEKVDIYDKVVRFIDTDVVPGKTYQYCFMVRMANPNFGDKENVVFGDLANIKELLSPASYTPEIPIPGEYFYYAVDHYPDLGSIGKNNGGSDVDKAKAEPPTPYGLWHTTLQVHKWVDKFEDRTIADWAIAERLLIRRGETMGRYEVMVEVPVWKKTKEAFEIDFQTQNVRKKSQQRAGSGIPLNFVNGDPPPLLVDFEGGQKHQVKVGKETIARDESMVELLILTTEGKLTVRNSRIDTEDMDRIARWKTWHDGIVTLRMAPKK